MHSKRIGIAILLLFVAALPTVYGYAVLTHEAIIDAAWDNIKPVILHRYPDTTPEQLKEAHSYAYGGCIIQDMGYYPFGSKYFSDLVHYVRSGDFVEALLREAQDRNEFAFALGSLAHYAADNSGHPIAVNPAVAIAYPKLRARFGSKVTYAEDPQAHLKTEFGFDVVEVAQGNYAPENYHDFIGFRVSKPLLQRAFLDTYTIPLNDQFLSIDLALGTYRRTVSTLLPEATKVAWSLKKDEIVKAKPGMAKRRFVYNLSRSSYEKEWNEKYERPGVFARFLAFLFRIVPKVGPFRGIAFQPPTAATEKLFMDSFNKTLAQYKSYLPQVDSGQLHLANMDFDTGEPARVGEYSLADKTYAKLMRQLAKHDFKDMTPDLRASLLAFHQHPAAPPLDRMRPKQTKQEEQDARDTQAALEKLKALDPAPAVTGK